MKQVYHMKFYASSDENNAEIKIPELLMSIKKFFQDKLNEPSSYKTDNVDKGLHVFLFKGFDENYLRQSEYTNFENISIDAKDFNEFLVNKINSMPGFFKNENGFEIELPVSIIFDTEAINIANLWKYDFLDLSKILDSRLEIFGYHYEFLDIIYQGYYDSGDYDTGMIAVQQEISDSSESEYLKSENPDSFPQDAIFELSTYNL